MADKADVLQCLRRHWCEILEIPSADPSQNFFGLGGDSLMAVELAVRVEHETGVQVPVDILFIDGDLRSVEAALTAS